MLQCGLNSSDSSSGDCGGGAFSSLLCEGVVRRENGRVVS